MTDEDPTVTRLFEGNRQFYWEGQWQTARELYEHPSRSAEMSLEQLQRRLSMVRKGEITLDWALTHSILKRCNHRDIDITWLSPTEDVGRHVAQFMLKVSAGESHRAMVPRAVAVASHHGAIEGIYLVRISTSKQATRWAVAVRDGYIHEPRPYEDDMDKKELFANEW